MEKETRALFHDKKHNTGLIIALLFLMVMVTLGFCSTTKPLYLTAITGALQMKRSVFSLSDSIRYITTAIINIFFGALISKHGSKKLIIAGLLALIIFTVAYAASTDVWGFYLGSMFLGMGLSWTTTTMVGFIVNEWCTENKGTIMGFVLAANGVGGVAATQIVSPFINDENNPFGYRNAYIVTAIILAALALLIIIFYHEKGDRAPSAKENIPEEENYSVADIIRQPYFVLIAIIVFITGMVLQGINSIGAAQMKDAGINADYVAGIMSCHSVFLAFSKFSSGFLRDRIGLRRTVLICDIGAVIAPILLLLVNPNPSGIVIAVLYCVCLAAAQPLETVVIPLLALDLFESKLYKKTMGLLISVNTAGFAFGSPVTNLCFDVFGSYTRALIVMSVFMFGITIVFQCLVKKWKLIPDSKACINEKCKD